MEKKAKHPVRTTEKSLQLIERLRDGEGGRVTELAEELDMGKGNVHNHLATLQEQGYVVKDGDEYQLSLKFLDIGGYVRDQMPLMAEGIAEIERLAEESGELVNLLTEQRGYGVYLYVSRGENAVELDTYAGFHTYLHSTAAGKAILAYLPEAEVLDIVEARGLPAETENTVTDIDALVDRLEQVRDRGYAIDDEERLKGLRCVAAPILVEDRAIGAVSISGPNSRISGDTFTEEIPEQVLNTANVIEIGINYS